MNDLQFISQGHLTLGVEIEIQLIDERNLDLFPTAIEILQRIGDPERVKPEIFQSMLEINSGICTDVHDVKADLLPTLADFYQVCREQGAYCSTTGTHPFANYSDRVLYPSDRYFALIDRNQWIAKRLSIFGLHVHLGMRSQEDCISFMNFFQHALPHLVALSASSPFWQSHNTGLASSRLTVFEASPTSGHSQCMSSWAEFEDQYASLKKCGAINSTKDLWWDMRPCPHYGTLEIRICDGIATLHELLGITAFIHSLAHWYDGLSESERRASSYSKLLPLWLIRENKWRALRYGLGMELITSQRGATRSLVEDIGGVLEFLEPVINRLGYAEYMRYIEMIVSRGNSSQRQLACFEEERDYNRVVELNVLEFEKSYVHNQICI